MPQFNLTNFNRFILATENDADSPDNEELMQQYMYNLVGLLILMLDTGISGTATADPTNVANSVFTDLAAVWTDNLHNGRTLLITSGTGKGLFYLINDTEDGPPHTLTLNDNLNADGVRNGDGYKILYDLKTNLDGHDHDGVNSKLTVLTDGKIMLPPWDFEEGIVYTRNGAWETKITGKIYVPVDAEVIQNIVRIKVTIGTTSFRFRVGGLTSNVVSTVNAAYNWVEGAFLNVSTLSGWQNFYLDIQNLTGQAAMQGYAFMWEKV